MRLTNHPVTIAALAVVLAFPLAARAGPKPAGAAAAMPPSGAQPEARHAGQRTEAAEARKAPPPLVEAKPPPFSEGIFPCSGCHTEPGDRTRRQLAFHEDIQEIFDHDSEHRWCLDCHDSADRDVLKLASGEAVPFTESYRLCGQCHGDKYRDWRAGVHGKRVGQWDGQKTYFLCVNCHNPHTPGFKGVKEVEVDGKKTTAPTLEMLRPEPRPLRPEEMRRRDPAVGARTTEGGR
jgi:hypothetical protein